MLLCQFWTRNAHHICYQQRVVGLDGSDGVAHSSLHLNEENLHTFQCGEGNVINHLSRSHEELFLKQEVMNGADVKWKHQASVCMILESHQKLIQQKG